MNNKNITTDFLSINDFAKKVGLHHITIRKYIKNGCINAFQIGPHPKSPYRIPISEIERIALFRLDVIVKKMAEQRIE